MKSAGMDKQPDLRVVSGEAEEAEPPRAEEDDNARRVADVIEEAGLLDREQI